ncbi:hypothetical protein FO519_006269 [Halicephalobus sp. NKZ332]|nr:hypothetical protein FO519_006269 [Halicephalobus sp. NKZ332]
MITIGDTTRETNIKEQKVQSTNESKAMRMDKQFFLIIVSVVFYIEDNIVYENYEITTGFVPKHCLIPDILPPKPGKEEAGRITLVLHASADRIDDSIVRQIDNWNGPVSLAVAFDFNFTGEEILSCYFKKFEEFKRSSKKTERYLSVHYLIQNEGGRCKELKKIVVAGFKEDCQGFFQKFQHMKKKIQFLSFYEKIKKMTSYEVNASRNLAKNSVKTDFAVVADLDHIFSVNFEERIRNFALDYLVKNPRTLLVYRIFEIQRNSEDPKDKAELETLLSSGKAREFHVANKNESLIEKLDEWLQYPGDEVTVQFIKNYSNPSWEPQFVSKKDIPDFDERFRYPMKDNTVLVT